MVAVRITASVSNLGPAVKRATAPVVARRADKAGRAMVESVQDSVSKYKVRPANRRRNPGSTRITTGWSYKVVGEPTSLPIFVNLIKAGDAVGQQRVDYLNDGTAAHTIRRGQSRTEGGRFGRQPWLRFPQGGAVSGPPWVYAKQVTHPGYGGDHFLEKAKEAGIAAATRR